MTHHYSDPSRETDKWSLPDIETFQLTAREVAEQYEELIYEYMGRRKFKLASVNSRDREAMFDAMIEEEGITGGWFYWFCFPGCLSGGPAMGPYETQAEALAAARDE
jgi:hypothetical protein